jgi:hypothetical protein
LLSHSAQLANDILFSNDLETVLINDMFSNDLNKMINIYREHPKHKEIEHTLDFLESELLKYINKSISIVISDFE